MNVFIAEDSKLMRERITTMLSEIRGLNVVGQADDAPKAIRSIRKLNPDVIILDIRMPGGNGIDVLRQIKSEPSAPLAIMLTNYPYPQYREKCLELGADYFLDKSTEFKHLFDILNTLMSESGKER